MEGSNIPKVGHVTLHDHRLGGGPNLFYKP